MLRPKNVRAIFLGYNYYEDAIELVGRNFSGWMKIEYNIGPDNPVELEVYHHIVNGVHTNLGYPACLYFEKDALESKGHQYMLSGSTYSSNNEEAYWRALLEQYQGEIVIEKLCMAKLLGSPDDKT
jgi:hypothetical protein